jgi:hypothetical protein
LILNATHQLLVCEDGVDILRANVVTIGENAEALVVVSKETGLEVNADTTKYMVTSRDQIAGKSYGINIFTSFVDRVEVFKYLGTNLTN